MKNTTELSELEYLARTTNKNIPDIIAHAIKIGINKLWKESIIEKYLKNQIDREEAVKLVGNDLVKIAEKQKEFVIKDIQWGMLG